MASLLGYLETCVELARSGTSVRLEGDATAAASDDGAVSDDATPASEAADESEIEQARAKLLDAVLHRHGSQLGPKLFDHLRKFFNGKPVAAAVATDQNPKAFNGWFCLEVGQGARFAIRMARPYSACSNGSGSPRSIQSAGSRCWLSGSLVPVSD